MKQGPSLRPGGVVPGRLAVRRPPPTPWWPPATSRWFAGSRQALLPEPRRLGATEGLASSHDTLPTVPRPYAGGFLGTRSRLPGAVHGLRLRNTGSAPSRPAYAGILNDAAGFASCCGP